jgi:hypothetical protein
MASFRIKDGKFLIVDGKFAVGDGDCGCCGTLCCEFTKEVTLFSLPGDLAEYNGTHTLNSLGATYTSAETGLLICSYALNFVHTFVATVSCGSSGTNSGSVSLLVREDGEWLCTIYANSGTDTYVHASAGWNELPYTGAGVVDETFYSDCVLGVYTPGLTESGVGHVTYTGGPANTIACCSHCTSNSPSEVQVVISNTFGAGGVVDATSLNTTYTLPISSTSCDWYLHYDGPSGEFVDGVYFFLENWAGVNLGGGYYAYQISYSYNGEHSLTFKVANIADPSTITTVIWTSGFIATPVDCCTELNYNIPWLNSIENINLDLNATPDDAVLSSSC